MEKNTNTHAKRELDILFKNVPDAIIKPFKNEIIELCDKFYNSGQSGGSAPYVAKAISTAVEILMLQRTIFPITGEDDEWNDVTEINDGVTMFQNNRDSRVFKDGVNGKAYFIDAIVFNGDKGGGFTGWVKTENGVDISSAQYIKSFPFTPKTFYVDVLDLRFKDKTEKELDENGDWWTHKIKDESQLDEVFKYYDKK